MAGKVFIIAEIGLNSNGDLSLTKEMIKAAKESGCDAVKFQKRNIDKVYTEEYLKGPRKSPWGTTQREQKEGLEFSEEEYDSIDKFCKKNNIEWFASAWDLDSQAFLRRYGCKYNKIASPMLVDKDFLNEVAKERKYTFISTGMSKLQDIATAVEIFDKHKCPFELMHCVSEYPLKAANANLAMIVRLRNTFDCEVGWSDHSMGNHLSIAAVTLGASSVERHFTTDRSLYGSDQKASIEPEEMKRMVDGIRDIEVAIGNGTKTITEQEKFNAKKLRQHIL